MVVCPNVIVLMLRSSQHSLTVVKACSIPVPCDPSPLVCAAVQVLLYDATQIEMDAQAAQVTAAIVPVQLPQTLQLGQTLSGGDIYRLQYVCGLSWTMVKDHGLYDAWSVASTRHEHVRLQRLPSS